jgi:hypothetical protein
MHRSLTRSIRLASLLLAGVPLTAMPAHAAGLNTANLNAPSADGARPGNVIGTDSSLPTSNQASNIAAGDTRSAIAPRLPDPAFGLEAAPSRYLAIAEQDLRARRIGAAQQALEMAETRLLDRAVPPSDADRPDQSVVVREVDAALQHLGSGDVAAAAQQTDRAMADLGGPRMAGANPD